MFPLKKAHDTINLSATDTITNTKKRKRSVPSIDSHTPHKKLVTLKLDPHILSTIHTATTNNTSTSIEPSNMPSKKPRARPNKKPPTPSDSTDAIVILNDSISSSDQINLPSKINRGRSLTTPIKLFDSTELRNLPPSHKESEQSWAPTITGLPQRSAKAIAHDARVEKVHSDGTLRITPCNRCFTFRTQCVKDDSSKSCSRCLYTRKRCEGAIKLGKWTDIDRKRVTSN
jgi:hypothetical protein